METNIFFIFSSILINILIIVSIICPFVYSLPTLPGSVPVPKGLECVEGAASWKQDCNDCFCADGFAACTKKICLPEQGSECVVGARWKQDCNDCFCSNGFAACTLKLCTPEPVFKIGSNQPMCEGVKCTWNLWSHYEAKGCTPEYINGSCCPTHFACPRPENLNPEKCYLFGKEYNIDDDVPLNGDDDKCFSGCKCYPGFQGERAEITCAQDVGLCWHYKPPSPGCRHKHNPCGGCPEEICDDATPHICSWNNKTYEEGQYMSFNGEYACHTCICQKNFTGPTGEGCKKIRCGHSGIDVRSSCVDVYHKDGCCPFDSLCDDNPKIQSVPTTSRVSTGLACTLGKFVRSVGEQLENEDCRINCTCLTPPEFTCIKTKTCLPEVPEEAQCPHSSSCINGECRQDCGDLVEVANQCSGNGCKCCRHERCAKDTGMCRMHCSDGEYEDTWTEYGCAFANNFQDPKPKCCVKNSLSTTELGPLETTEHPAINE